MNPQDIIGKIIGVLDQGWVRLADVMASDAQIIQCARTTRRGLDTDEIEIISEENQRRMLHRMLLAQPPETSPFERAEVVFHVRLPGLVLWHWKRHRTFRWWDLSVKSGRVSEYQAQDFYHPLEWRPANEKKRPIFQNSQEIKELSELLDQQYNAGYRLYKQTLDLGVAKEQARLFLNNFAIYTELSAKCDLHNFMHFLRLRLDHKAQWEIRQYARVMYELFAEAFPLTRLAFDAQVARDRGEG